MLNEGLFITYDNQIYSIGNQGYKVKMSKDEALTDDQIVRVYSGFLNQYRELATKQKLIITINLREGGHELTFEPLMEDGAKKVQGELPVEFFFRYGRHLVFNDFKALIQRLGAYKIEKKDFK